MALLDVWNDVWQAVWQDVWGEDGVTVPSTTGCVHVSDSAVSNVSVSMQVVGRVQCSDMRVNRVTVSDEVGCG